MWRSTPNSRPFSLARERDCGHDVPMERGSGPLTPSRAIVLAVAAGCAITYVTDWHSPVRVVLSLAFLLACPGLAIVGLLRVREPVVQFAIVPATSIAAGSLVALVLVNANWFTPGRVLLCLEILTVALLLIAIARDSRSAHHAEAGLR
jgi:hypothetical protein